MRSSIIQFVLVFGAAVSALAVLDALFEPSGGPRIEAPAAPPPPVDTSGDPEVREYFHPHYDRNHALVWIIKGGRARGLSGRNMRLCDTEFTLVQYGREMGEIRRVTVSAPEASGDWDKEGKGALSFPGRVEIRTTDGIVLRTSDLRCSFARDVRAAAEDPLGGWDWEFGTDREVEITGPGFGMTGSGLRGVRDEMRLTVQRNPSASIGSGLSGISGLGRIGEPAGVIAIRASGPMVLTAGAPSGKSMETDVRLRFENRVLLSDRAPDGAGGFRTESLLGARVLEADMTFTGDAAGAKEGKKPVVSSVRGEGGVRCVNLDGRGFVEAAWSGNSAVFERSGGAGGAAFRITGVPRAVLLSSSSITSGILEGPEAGLRGGDSKAAANLLWIASDNELAASTAAGAAQGGPGRAAIAIPHGATVASYVPAAGAAAGIWEKDLRGAAGPEDIPAVEALRSGFRPDAVLTSKTAELVLSRIARPSGGRAAWRPESFLARGETLVADYGESGRMEAFCRAEEAAFTETASAEAGADLRREVRIEGGPVMGFHREFRVTSWSGGDFRAKGGAEGPAMFILACREAMYGIAFLRSEARGGAVVRQLVNLEGEALVEGFSTDGPAGGELFTPGQRPAPGWRRHLVLKAGSAELSFLPRPDGGRGADLDSVRAGGGVMLEILGADGGLSRTASGREFEWTAGKGGPDLPAESGKLEGDARLGFCTEPNAFPLRHGSRDGEDWVEVSSPESVSYARKAAGEGAGGAETVEVAVPGDAEVTATPMALRGSRVEWKLRADSLSAALGAAGPAGSRRWSPCSLKGSGSVTFYNYNDAGSVEAWGRSRSAEWSRAGGGGPVPEQWTLVLDGAPMVQFPAQGVFEAGGAAHAAAGSGTPRDAWVRIEASKRMNLEAKAYGTPSEVVTLKAEGNAVLTASGTIEGDEGRSFLKMEAPEIWCDSAAVEEAGGEAAKRRRAVKEARGSGDTVITLLQPGGSAGVYRGADLSFNAAAGEGETRVRGPGKWTFQLTGGSK